MNHQILFLAITLICSLAPYSLHATRLTTAFATYEGAWGLAAVANLSRFRTNLFDATMEATSLGEPQGHKRYDLFPPIVTCPPSTSLTLVGEPEGVSTSAIMLPNILAVAKHKPWHFTGR